MCRPVLAEQESLRHRKPKIEKRSSIQHKNIVTRIGFQQELANNMCMHFIAYPHSSCNLTNHFSINNYCYFAWVAIGATSNHKKQNHRSSTVIHRLVAFLPGSMKNKQKFGKETILHSFKISHYTCQQSHYGTHWLMIIVYVCISVIWKSLWWKLIK